MTHRHLAVSGHHRYRRASHLYNESWREVHISQISSVVDTKRTKLRHSRMIPAWLSSFFAVVFGVSTAPNTRPITGTILYCFTLFFALLHAITSAFFIYYDVVSSNTKSTIFTGTANVVLGLAWTMIGVYGNDLGRRILSNPGLVSNVRMHARTIFRLNAAVAITGIAFVALAIHIYMAAPTFNAHQCQLVNLNFLVCKLRYVSSCIYSFIVLFWNAIVACLCMSMCRTFTIVCRRFIRELEREGKVMEKIYRLELTSRTKEVEEMHHRAMMEPSVGGLWDVGATLAEVTPSAYMEDVESDLSDEEDAPPAVAPRGRSQSNFSNFHASVPSTIPEVPSSAETSRSEDLANSSALASENELQTISHGGELEENLRRNMRPHSSRQLHPNQAHSGFGALQDLESLNKMLFTEDDLCMRFWKINCQLRITSLVFQRWLSTWCAFVAFWAFSYIVYWLKHNAEVMDFVYFLLPILLVAIVCSAYAEVNLESSRIIYSLCPKAGRLQFNRFINSQPAYLTVFSMPMTYQVMTGLVIAFGVAFASRIIMDEFRAAR